MKPWLKSLREWFGMTKPAPRTVNYRLRPVVELLEDRLAPSSATYTVTTNLDNNVAHPGKVSLRDAITLANADGKTSDIINFNASALTGKTIKLTSGTELLITKSVTIVGLGANQLTIDGGAVGGEGGTRIFEINAPTGKVALTGLTLTHGQANVGGAILNDSGSTLTVQGCILTGNTATNDGAVSNSGTLTVQSSTISGNQATSFGGGIGNFEGALTVQSSTISGNHATSNGGGIENIIGTLKLQASTLSGNTTAGNGGGISSKYSIGSLQNCTLSGNIATGNGGGIFSDGKYNATLQNCTIAFNKAASGGGMFVGADYYGSSTVNLRNTIVSDNSGAHGLNDLAIGSYAAKHGIIDAQYCLIETPAGALDAGSKHNILGVSADLELLPGSLQGWLKYNGGPVQVLTLKPQRGSPALKNGSVIYVTPDMPTDERGFPRTYGGTVDIGAVEATLDYLRRTW